MALPDRPMKVFGIAGHSGAGKTTLIEHIIPVLVQHGLKVSLIKHAHDRFDIDRPGKDSYRHREAGASEVLLTSAHRWVLMHESRNEAEPDMAAQLAVLSPCDVVLVEGYKRWPLPKLEVWRAATGKPPMYLDDPSVIAIATDCPDTIPDPGERDVLDLDQPAQIALWLLDTLNRLPAAR
jgi:molybdopterin-guanine dinucleotide biosynthesis protein B